MNTKMASRCIYASLFILCCSAAGNLGCFRTKSREHTAHTEASLLDTKGEAPNTRVALESTERNSQLAEAEAIIAALRKTSYLESLRRNFGAVYLLGVSDGTANDVKGRIGNKLPVLRRSLHQLDQSQWTDKETRKPAIVVETQTVSVGERECAFRVITRTYSRGGTMCLARMKKANGEWQVAEISVLIAD